MSKQPATFNFAQEGDDAAGETGGFNIEAMIAAEKAKIKEANEKFLRELPAQVRQRVNVLQVLHDDYESLRKDFQRELAELEKKYEQKYAPVFDRRRVIVSGDAELTSEETERAAKRVADKAASGETSGVQIQEDTAAATPAAATAEAAKGIPDFWKQVLLKSELMGELIQEHDVPSLDFLREIRVEQFDDGKAEDKSQGFHIDFVFAENPFFSNDRLRKTYFLDSQDKQTIQECEGSEIQWKDESKNLTIKVTVKTQRHKGGKGTRKVRKEEPRESLYNWFKSTEQQMESVPEELQEQMDYDDLVESDFEVGHLIRDDIVPNAVEYYTGSAALQSIEHTLMNSIMGEDDEEEGDEEEDEDEDEEVEDTRAAMGRMNVRGGGRGGAGAGRGGRGGHGGAQENPECKQQ
jgi:nucleosome assembly protein 1-like 1